jgi:flagellar motor switch protein FliG
MPAAATAPAPSTPSSPPLSGLERTALLVMALPAEATRALLRHMSAEEIERIGLAMAGVTHVSAAVVGEVIAQFVRELHEASLVPRTGAQFALSVLPELVDEPRRDRVGGTMRRQLDPDFERVIASRPARTVAAALQHEAPQTQAVALALMGPDNAGRVLVCLDPADQHDLALRIARLEEIPGDVADEVRTLVLEALSLTGASRLTVEGPSRAAKALVRIPKDAQDAVLEKIGGVEAKLAEDLRRRMVTFDELVSLPDRAVQALLKHIDKDQLVVALRGVPTPLRDRFLRNMSSRAAADMVEEIEIRGPQPRNVVADARDAIVAVVLRLTEEGVIRFSATGDDLL